MVSGQDFADEFDVIVVGSGIAGLGCAALLAKAGLSVQVCEAHSLPGGGGPVLWGFGKTAGGGGGGPVAQVAAGDGAPRESRNRATAVGPAV